VSGRLPAERALALLASGGGTPPLLAQACFSRRPSSRKRAFGDHTLGPPPPTMRHINFAASLRALVALPLVKPPGFASGESSFREAVAMHQTRHSK
jgi:hypothetical protein